MTTHPIPDPTPDRCATCDQPIHWAGSVDPGWVHDRPEDVRRFGTFHPARPAREATR